MTFKDQMADDLDNVFFNTDEFAVEVVYIPSSSNYMQNVGVSQIIKTIKAFVDYDVDQNFQGIKSDGYVHILPCERDVRSNFKRGSTRNVATVTVKASDVPDPQYRDKINIDGVTWTVTEIFDHA